MMSDQQNNLRYKKYNIIVVKYSIKCNAGLLVAFETFIKVLKEPLNLYLKVFFKGFKGFFKGFQKTIICSLECYSSVY